MSEAQALQTLKQTLKVLIVQECEKDIDPITISDDEPLFGAQAKLGLDSLDALQIAMALQTHYGIKLTDSKKVRKILKNINTLANFLHEQ